MKNLLLLACILVFATSCSSIKVSSDFDKTAGFSSYKTYAFTPEALALPLDDINRNRLLAAVEKELAAKGFTKSDNPDVLINLSIKTKTQQTATATNSGGMDMVQDIGMAMGEAFQPPILTMIPILMEPCSLT